VNDFMVFIENDGKMCKFEDIIEFLTAWSLFNIEMLSISSVHGIPVV